MRQRSGLSRGDHTALVSSESSSAWAQEHSEGAAGSEGTSAVGACTAHRISHPSGPCRRVLTCQQGQVSLGNWGPWLQEGALQRLTAGWCSAAAPGGKARATSPQTPHQCHQGTRKPEGRRDREWLNLLLHPDTSLLWFSRAPHANLARRDVLWDTLQH